MAAGGNAGGRSAGGGGAGGGSAALSPAQHIAALQELGRRSDVISSLNQRTEKAFTAWELAHSRRQTETGKESRWRDLQKQLETAYKGSVEFSTSKGITKLPVPSGLQQRGSR